MRIWMLVALLLVAAVALPAVAERGPIVPVVMSSSQGW
jgi:hypothetical protein